MLNLFNNEISDNKTANIVIASNYSTNYASRQEEAPEYDAYPEMALEVLGRIRDEVEARHPGCRLALAHRTGLLGLGEASVVVACGAPHRREAFAACRLAMDRIKESVPVWKHERTEGGEQRWL